MVATAGGLALLEVVEAHFDEPWLAPLAQHIRNSDHGARSKRFASIRHVADLFDRYGVHRPEMVQRWAAGTDGEGEAFWQMELWRLLRVRIGQPSPADAWSIPANASATNPNC